MDIRLIALDLDGTTLNQHGEISELTRRTLEAAITRGIRVVIASGRALSALPLCLSEISGLQYAITSNGSSIFSLIDGRRLYNCDMRPEAVLAVLDAFLPSGFAFEVFADGQAYTTAGYHRCPADYGVPPRMTDYVQRTRQPVDDMAGFVLQHKNTIEGMNLIATHSAKKAAIYKLLKERSDLYITTSSDYYMEIADSHVSKASALHTLSTRLHIQSNQIIAFGDADNDLELLTYAGHGVAMANATDRLKVAADAITFSNDEDGMARYLQKLLSLAI